MQSMTKADALLDVKCPEYLAEVRKFADENGIRDKLEQELDRLSDFVAGRSKCTLYKDFAPQSFAFSLALRNENTQKYEPWIEGGLIFYRGSESGVGSPQLSVTLSGRKDSRWEIHT